MVERLWRRHIVKMEEENIIIVKTRKFAGRIVKLARFLRSTKKEYVLAEQILRSGISIGANVSEGNFGQSGADFYTKFKVALKEAGETQYWIELLHDTDCLNDEQYKSIKADCDEIVSLLVAITKTFNEKNNK